MPPSSRLASLLSSPAALQSQELWTSASPAIFPQSPASSSIPEVAKSVYCPVHCQVFGITSRLLLLCGSRLDVFGDIIVMPCCKCARDRPCVRCSCAEKGKPCSNCYPRRENGCRNPHNPHVSASSQPVASSLATSRPPSLSTLSQPALAAVATSTTLLTRSQSKSQPVVFTPDGGSSQASSTSCPLDSAPLVPPTSTGSPPVSILSVETSTSGDSQQDGADSSPDDLCPRQVEAANNIIVTWRRNLFIVPYGTAGGEFVDELTRLVESFVTGGPLCNVAWRAVAVACQLLLQKPHNSKIMANHSEHLRRRLQLWRSGCIQSLIEEGACIQAHLPSPARTPHDSPECSDAIFSNLVITGRLHSAVRYLSPESSSGVLGMSDVVDPVSGKTVQDVLREKHPQASSAPDHTLLPGNPEPINPILFQRITPELIKPLSRQMHGSSGPSGLDADAWARLLTSYKASSNSLCSALAAAARCLCINSIDRQAMEGFTSARLIPLNKNPGVRPIAVGEVHRRIICKAIATVIEGDVMRVVAPVQTCVGIPSACETSVHIMSALFSSPDTEGILMVDASNAFNALNREAALHNVARLCPALAGVIKNTYSHPIRLFVSGGGEVASAEGTCQGDPLAMALYAVSISPLVQRLQDACPSIRQSWYADDDAAAGSLSSLKSYWDELQEIGPGYGYYPSPRKTVLLVKPEFLERAQDTFRGTEIAVTAEGSRYLGGFLGAPEFCKGYVAGLSAKWVGQLHRLSVMAQTQPQAAYAVFTKCLSGRWTYHLRCLEIDPHSLKEMDDVILREFIPSLLGHEVAEESSLREILAFPARFGGLAIPVLSAIAEQEHAASLQVTAPMVQLTVPPPPPSKPDAVSASCPRNIDAAPGSADVRFFTQNSTVSASCPPRVAVLPAAEGIPLPEDPADAVAVARQAVRRGAVEYRREKVVSIKERAAELRPSLPSTQQLLLDIAGEKGVSSWVTATPSCNLPASILTKSDFRDALDIRYGLALKGLPTECVCGQSLTIDHAFTCPCGGYPIAQHNEIRDVLAEAMSEVVPDVTKEPVLLPFDGEALPGRSAVKAQEARLDIRARGFWSRQQDAFFDVRVTHPKASLLSRSEVVSQLRQHEQMKKRQYGARVNRIDRGAFTPLVFSTSGMCGPEASIFLKSLAGLICEKHTDLQYSQVMRQLRCRLSFSLLRWAVTCFRGCRSSYGRRAGLTIVQACRKFA